jgi:tRNA threonylcarbamoyladenosine biosynthesis protein TsaB
VLILGIETATESVGVALGGRDGVLASVAIARGRRHGETVAPAVQFACHHAGVELRDLDAVAVDIGPGLFTGMRVGMATAKALAMALDIPVVPVTSLEVLAEAAESYRGLVVPVVDARKGEVFWSMHRSDEGGVTALGEPSIGGVDDLVAALGERGQHALCLGDGAHRHATALRDGADCALSSERHPSADVLVAIAVRRALREEWISADLVAPLYLRRPDAEINWETREVRA